MAKETTPEANNQPSISLAELKEKNITDLAKIAKDAKKNLQTDRKSERMGEIQRTIVAALNRNSIFKTVAAPLKIKQGSGSPLRVLALVSRSSA